MSPCFEMNLNVAIYCQLPMQNLVIISHLDCLFGKNEHEIPNNVNSLRKCRGCSFVTWQTGV